MISFIWVILARRIYRDELSDDVSRALLGIDIQLAIIAAALLI